MDEQEIRPGESQRFIKNNKYFTICVYAFILVIISTIAIRMIVSFKDTRNFFGGIFSALSPFLLALLIAYILSPFEKGMSRLLRFCLKKLPETPRRILSILLVYMIALGLVITLLTFVLPEVAGNLVDLIGRLPTAYEQTIAGVKQLQERFKDIDFTGLLGMMENFQTTLMQSLQDVTGTMIPALYSASVSVVSWFVNILISVVVSVYMLYGKKSLKKLIKILIAALFPEQYVPVVRQTLSDCSHIFSSYVASKMIDSLIIGILCAIVMTILRLPYVFLISLVVGVTNMIPYFGPFIGAVPGVVILLAVSPVKAFIFAIMILCLQQFDGLYLGPKLMGNSTGMKPIWIIFAITIGGKFAGVLGMFLGVPFMAILVYLLERTLRWMLKRKNLTMEEIK